MVEDLGCVRGNRNGIDCSIDWGLKFVSGRAFRRNDNPCLA